MSSRLSDLRAQEKIPVFPVKTSHCFYAPSFIAHVLHILKHSLRVELLVPCMHSCLRDVGGNSQGFMTLSALPYHCVSFLTTGTPFLRGFGNPAIPLEQNLERALLQYNSLITLQD
jgi:hypothetical protein